MRLVIRLVVALIVLFALVMGLQQIAAESGEVVILTTRDDAGESHQTRLWVVDHDGQQWLRAGVAQSGWLLRLQADSLVKVERDGASRDYVAVPDPSREAEINDLMSEKYGWADSYIGFLFGRDGAVPIGLQDGP
jgi:hypothetical protein